MKKLKNKQQGKNTFKQPKTASVFRECKNVLKSCTKLSKATIDTLEFRQLRDKKNLSIFEKAKNLFVKKKNVIQKPIVRYNPTINQGLSDDEVKSRQQDKLTNHTKVKASKT